MEVPVVIARQNLDGTEMEFANMLFEDSNNDALAYTECKLASGKSLLKNPMLTLVEYE